MKMSCSSVQLASSHRLDEIMVSQTERFFHVYFKKSAFLWGLKVKLSQTSPLSCNPTSYV